MRVLVLNGPNLDVLHRRDPKLYGGISLHELESRVYSWASDLGIQAKCEQTNHEGRAIDLLHEALDWAGGLIINPGAWTHYSYAIRDAVEKLNTTMQAASAELYKNAQASGQKAGPGPEDSQPGAGSAGTDPKKGDGPIIDAEVVDEKKS